MFWANVYKTSRSAGGLLVNSYYCDISQPDPLQWLLFAPAVQEFDAAFSATDTVTLLITGQPAQAGGKLPETTGRVWYPTNHTATGTIQVAQPLAWRWCLSVGLFTGGKPTGNHPHHDAVSYEDLTYDSKGNCKLRMDRHTRDLVQARQGLIGRNYREWLRVGTGSAQPGNALSFLPVIEALPVGISVRNKARRAQALILNDSINLQQKCVGTMGAGALAIKELYDLHDEDTGHWIRGRLKSVVLNLQATAISMCQTFHDLDLGENDQKINEGDGWNSRWGTTSADISGKLEFFKEKQKQDLKYLQLFPSFTEPSGEEWFTNENAREWFTIADEWAQYQGMAAGFDFMNSNQKGLKDMTRLDNYTPLWPDLPNKVENLPRPQKNPDKKQYPVGLFL